MPALSKYQPVTGLAAEWAAWQASEIHLAQIQSCAKEFIAGKAQAWLVQEGCSDLRLSQELSIG